MEIKLTELQLKDGAAATIAKRIRGLLDDKCQQWIENKDGHIEKNEKPTPKFIRCQHNIFHCIIYAVMNDELQGLNKFPYIDYCSVQDEVGKNDQLKEAFSRGKVQIFKNTRG